MNGVGQLGQGTPTGTAHSSYATCVDVRGDAVISGSGEGVVSTW